MKTITGFSRSLENKDRYRHELTFDKSEGRDMEICKAILFNFI